MSENKHTSGPWKIDEVQELPLAVIQDNGSGFGICEIETGERLSPEDATEEDLANARLIAAAPDLLKACKRAYFLLETNNIKDEYFEILKIGLGDLLPSQVVDQKLIEAAIAQAEKES